MNIEPKGSRANDTVTGATGSKAVQQCAISLSYWRIQAIRALTRRPRGPAATSLRALGVEVVEETWMTRSLWRQLFSGVWGVFGVQNTWEAGVTWEEVQGRRAGSMDRRESRVTHFVYGSVASANRWNRIPSLRKQSARRGNTAAAGFPSYAGLRPVFFMENPLMPSTQKMANSPLR